MPIASLTGRATLDIAGADAAAFLQNLITADLEALGEGVAAPAALLTPQGKILFDFLVSRQGQAFRLDVRKELVADLLKRLTLYRLRSKVEFSLSEQANVAVCWENDSPGHGWLRDLRFGGAPVFRRYDDAGEADRPEADWHALRIRHGVGESGTDFQAGDAFPHDVLMDQNGGISFAKGCFVGQEVVSRMQHRGTARRRLLIAHADAPLPAPATQIMAGEKPIGQLGTVIGAEALAMVRIDRVAQAKTSGVPLLADGVELALSIPEWAGIEFPQVAGAGEEQD